jgi:Ca2+-binding EF-hand superfamily protein
MHVYDFTCMWACVGMQPIIRSVQKDTLELALQIFRAFDVDSSGSLSQEEFRQLLQMLYGKRAVPADDVEDFAAMLQLSTAELDYGIFVEVSIK